MRPSKSELQIYSSWSKNPLSLKGKWSNELGSVMDVQHVNGDAFSGEYSSKVSDTGKSVKGTLSGTVAGDTIGFIVNWKPDFASVTSWSGKILATDTGAAYIYTLWHLSRGVKDPKDWWQSFLSGSDTFFRTGS